MPDAPERTTIEGVEYVRADVVAANQAEMQAEIDSMLEELADLKDEVAELKGGDDTL